jgi:hypothetical protein
MLLVAVVGCDEQPDPQAMEIARRVSVSARKPAWETVTVDRANSSSYRLEIVYKTVPRDYETVEADTRSLIRALLAEIKKSGKEPGRIIVFTKRDVAGETGKPLVQDFGYATYNSIQDTIQYHVP